MNKLIILGSGPAGLTAAIYAARAQLSPLVIDGTEPGGQLTKTTDIENWPGASESLDAQKLMADMRAQAARFGTQFKSGEVTAAQLTEKPISITLGSEQLQTHSLIIATGASARMLGLESEQALLGRGVSTCATCDGFFFRGKNVLVVGGGDTAIEEALYLSKLAAEVTLVHRRDQLRAEKIMQERAFKVPNLRFLWDSVVAEIHDREKQTVTGASIKNLKTGQTDLHVCDGVFMALGHVPNTKPFRGQLDLDDSGFIRTTQGSATNIAGVFGAGDVADPSYKQAVTAAGMGCMAALDAERYLQGV